MKPDNLDHDSEIEVGDDPATRRASGHGLARFRVSCSCGFVGPWREVRSSARRDRNQHEDRRAAGEA